MDNQFLITGGTIVTAETEYQADILVDNGRIEQIGTHIPFSGLNKIDATGKLIIPGGIDPHTHFDLPMFNTISSDDHYSGTRAAAFGGTTTVLDFIPQDGLSIPEAIEIWMKKAVGNVCVDYSMHMNISRFDEQVAKDIATLPNYGISSIKVFTAYNERLRLSDEKIFKVMRIARDNGILTLAHAENGDVIDLHVQEAIAQGFTDPIWHARTRPNWSAGEAIMRIGSFAAILDAPTYIVHMNTRIGADVLAYLRNEDVPIMGETCPQYLLLTEDTLLNPDGAKYVCSPPLRTIVDNARLWDAVSHGEIHVLATDHCAFFNDGTNAINYEGEKIKIAGKELGKKDFRLIPNGLPGVGDRMPILWQKGVNSGKLTKNQFVALTSTNASKIFGLYPQKGTIAEGSDADIVIWDPQKEVHYGVDVAQHRTDYNLYEDVHLTGFPEKVFLRGKLIVDSGNWLGKRGDGKYIHRRPNAEIM